MEIKFGINFQFGKLEPDPLQNEKGEEIKHEAYLSEINEDI